MIFVFSNKESTISVGKCFITLLKSQMNAASCLSAISRHYDCLETANGMLQRSGYEHRLSDFINVLFTTKNLH